MKKTVTVLFLFFTSFCTAQSYLGYAADNYNGIHGVMVNPANIADARVKVDINLVSVSALAANDYISLSLDNVEQLTGDSGFAGLNTFASDQNNVLVNLEVLGPAFMFNINEKHSVGLFTRARFVNNYNNINGELFESILDGFPSEDFDFEQNNLDGTTHIWGEIGLSYGRVLFNDFDRHFLKAGATIKYLLGAGVAQGNSNTLSGSFTASNEQVALNGDFSYLISYEDDQEVSEYLNDLSPGVGADIGVVYEYRTRESRLGSANDNPRALNKYKVKVGLSLLDFGKITYKNVELSRYDINGTVSAQDAEEDFIDALENNFPPTTSEGDVTLALPTSLRLNIDYNILHKVYLNLDLNQTMVKQNDPYNNNRLNLITLTPRFETRLLGAYLPISYSQLGKTALGFGFRIGPLIMGSGGILSNLLSENVQMTNFYFGIKAPIKYKRR